MVARIVGPEALAGLEIDADGVDQSLVLAQFRFTAKALARRRSQEMQSNSAKNRIMTEFPFEG